MKINHYSCCTCGKTIQTERVIYLCPDCEKTNLKETALKGVLYTTYDFDSLRKKSGNINLFEYLRARNFLDILPISDLSSFPSLRVGQTPLYGNTTTGTKGKVIQYFLKDDSQNPTFSFKDRASNLVSAFAKEHGLNTIAAASTGNAGSSLAGICASNGQQSVIFVPGSAPIAKLTQIAMYGAKLIPVDGNYDMAFDLSLEASRHFGWYNRNTAYNPLTIEGKKMVSLELYSQLGNTAPDMVFIPVGDGVILSGVYKGFEDLLHLGLIEKMPVIIAVQAEGSQNIAANLIADVPVFSPTSTVADSICVDIPRNFFMAIDFLKKYQGECCIVTDNEILDASVELARTKGIFTEPASAAAYAGFLNYSKNNGIRNGSKAVILLTGSGLKDSQSVQKKIQLPPPIVPSLSAVEELLKLS